MRTDALPDANWRSGMHPRRIDRGADQTLALPGVLDTACTIVDDLADDPGRRPTDTEILCQRHPDHPSQRRRSDTHGERSHG